LPERPISPHPNYVTAKGLAQIEAEIAHLSAEQATVGADSEIAARIARDLRYWRARRSSAQLTEPPPDGDRVQFGTTVTIEREDGRRQTWRIVGEDEADPETGTLSYLAPLARTLIGKEVGDTVRMAGGEAEVIGLK
jgi:transcription elongation GreA/GreB family factor